MRKANELFIARRSLKRNDKDTKTRRDTRHYPAMAHQLANSKQFQLQRNTLLRSILNLNVVSA